MNQNKFVCKPSEKLKVFVPINLTNTVNEIKNIKNNENRSLISLNLLLSHQKKSIAAEQRNHAEDALPSEKLANSITCTEACPKVICNSYDKNSQSFLNIDLQNLAYDMKMFIRNLEYDSRVKKFNQSENEIVIDFYNINASISFYKQYLNCYDMQFISNVNMNWIEGFKHKTDTAPVFKSKPIVCNSFFNNLLPFKIIFNKKTCDYTEAVDDNDILKSNLKQKKVLFNQKIKYYASICKFFTSCEIKKMQVDIENGCYDFIFHFTKELSVGLYTNIFFQEIIQNLTQDKLFLIIKNLASDIAPISSTKYGAYVIQTVIDRCKDLELQTLVKHYMKPYMVELLQHQIGNYSAQTIANFDEHFVLDIFYKNLAVLINNDLSFKVFKKYYSLFKKNSIEIDKKINDIYKCLCKQKQVEILAFLQEYSNKKIL